VGEVSDALEKVFGRHRADTQKVTGVYAAAYDSAEGWDQLKKEIADFAEAAGPPPRVMISQAGPGRPRPRRQGGGHGLCRPGL
jgi:methylmalonyl-CoA mutase